MASQGIRKSKVCVSKPDDYFIWSLARVVQTSIREGAGVASEAVWMLMLPLFAQLQKRHYWTEAFVHVVNLVAAWPQATRKMLQHNCSVNVKGRQGHCLALDEWVETYIVLPLKKYASGK